MSQISVVYATMTGHSKKIAEKVGEALGVTALNIARDPLPEDAELLFIVGGLYGGESRPELLEYVKNLDVKKFPKAALITSCASTKQKQESVRKLLLEKGVEVVDEILLPGSFLVMKMGHPNTKDIEEAVEFARGLASGSRVG